MSDEKISISQDDQKWEEKTIRIWICSWNMAASTQFNTKIKQDGTKIPDDKDIKQFEQFVPVNYDLYIFGVQEGVDEIFYQLISNYLKKYGVIRLKLNKNDDRVSGRGDGSFLSQKFTGIAVYFKKIKKQYIKYKSCAGVSAGLTQGSKGAACVILKIYSTTICFISAHLSSNSPYDKLQHIKTIIDKAGSKLGGKDFNLLEQFHHIVWFGDLNYRITTLSAEKVLELMAKGKLGQLWKNDSLKIELNANRAWFNFKEPNPRLDFYPTYKKKPDRQLDFDVNPNVLQQASPSSMQSCFSQLDKIYRTKYKEPFYKGGSVHDRIPSFCDRLLFHSLKSTFGQLMPEIDNGILNCVETTYKDNNCHNYGVIPHNLMGSDHSAIYCGLTLKSPMMLACPPHESNEHGNPKSYVLKIKNLTILRQNNNNNNNNNYMEFPLKMKFLFPAPYEIDNELYDPTPIPTILHKNDLIMMHQILRDIENESQKRISTDVNDDGYGNSDKNIIIKKPPKKSFGSIKDNRQPSKKRVLNVLKGSKTNKNTNIKTEENYYKNIDNDIPSMASMLTSVTKNIKNKKPPKRSHSKSFHGNANENERVSNLTKKFKKKKRSTMDQLTIKNNNKKLSRTPSPQPFHHSKSVPHNIKSSVDDDIDVLGQFNQRLNSFKGDNNNNGINNTGINNVNINNNYAVINNHHITRKPPNEPPPNIPRYISATNIDDDNFIVVNKNVIAKSAPNSPRNVLLTFDDKKDNKNKTNNNGNINSQMPSINISPKLENNISSFENKSKKSLELDKEYDENEFKQDIFDVKIVNYNTNINTSQNKNNIDGIAPIQTHNSFAPKMRKMRSRSRSISYHTSQEENNLSTYKSEQLFKQLKSYQKKLTLTSYGPMRRPSYGYIHVIIRVKTHDFEGQTYIPFKWDSFAKKEHGIKYGKLTDLGLPIINDKTKKQIQIRLDYKLSLEDEVSLHSKQ